MGWKEGQGLGTSGAGVAAPISANTDFGGDKRGLGAEDHTAVQSGDDAFEDESKSDTISTGSICKEASG